MTRPEKCDGLNDHTKSITCYAGVLDPQTEKEIEMICESEVLAKREILFIH